MQALGQVVRVWCDRSAMQHSLLVQHLYISEALALFATCATERSEGQLNHMGVSTGKAAEWHIARVPNQWKAVQTSLHQLWDTSSILCSMDLRG